MKAIDWLSHPVTEDGEGYLLFKSPGGAVLRISNEERQHIVKCVSMHDPLVELLEQASYYVAESMGEGSHGARLLHDAIEPVLAKAKGE